MEKFNRPKNYRSYAMKVNIAVDFYFNNNLQKKLSKSWSLTSYSIGLGIFLGWSTDCCVIFLALVLCQVNGCSNSTTVEASLVILFFIVGFIFPFDFMEMDLFMVVFFFDGGGVGDLDLMSMVFISTTLALALKAGCLTSSMLSVESERRWYGERRNGIMSGKENVIG